MTVQLIWEIGTAYDFFLSLRVLHEPERYGLRGAWAAGVRSRLPAGERDFLQKIAPFIMPLTWLHRLPQPQNGQQVLQTLADIPVEQRLATLDKIPDSFPAIFREIMSQVGQNHHWSDEDVSRLRLAYPHQLTPTRKEIAAMLDIWAQPEAFGESVLAALQLYYDNFFGEEESRILPLLQVAVEKAQELAGRLPFATLLEELSQGLRYTDLPAVSELVMVPSFWITPLVIKFAVKPGREMFIFGARPENLSLVPGEPVPDAMYQALKALADPTRLSILRYLMAEPQSPSQLSRRLRLRAPTVVHHLHTLRLARLVHLTMEAEGKRRYALRPGAVEMVFQALQTFLND